MLLSRITYKGIALTLFLFLFAYLCLRAIYVEPLHDELATYYFYIYQGDFYGKHEVFDANNHLLNSLLSHFIYKLSGDNWLFLRLPNLLAFVLYSYGLYELIKNLSNKWNKIIVFSGIASIPFILEYFANCRGYGLSMGFFIVSLSFFVSYFKSGRIAQLWLAYFLVILAVASNLTFITISMLLIVYIIVYTLVIRNYKLLLPTLLFFCALIPFILFGLTLKEKGALYYGSLDGIWDVTGESLFEYTVFFKGVSALLICLVLLLAIIFYSINQLIKKKLIDNLKDQFFFLSYLSIGSIVLIAFLALFFKVNYPSDRTAMYLIPIILLVLGSVIDRIQWHPLMAIYLFFPISLFFHFSLSTSVFSPDDRMSQEFYDEVKKHLKDTDNLMIYNTMGWNWPYKESKSLIKSSNPIHYQANKAFTDVLLTKTSVMNDPKLYENYDTIALDEQSTYIALKRKTPTNKIQFDSLEIEEIFGDWEYITVLEEVQFNDWPKGNPIQITVTGVMETFEAKHYGTMVLQLFDNNGEQIEYEYFPFYAYYHGRKINDRFRLNFLLEKLPENIGELKLYLWNKGLDPLLLKQVKCYLYEVNYP